MIKNSPGLVILFSMLFVCSYIFAGEQAANDTASDSSSKNSMKIYSEEYYKDNDNSLKSAKLVEDSYFSLADGNRILLKAGYRVYFYEDGNLQSGVTAEDTSFGSTGAFFAGTRVELYPDGKLLRAYILTEYRRQEILNKVITVKKVDILTNKKIVSTQQSNLQLVSKIKVNEFTIRGNNKENIAIEDVESNKLEVDKNVRDVNYYEGKTIKSGTLISDMHFALPGRRSIVLMSNTSILLYENENLKSGTLAEDTVFNEISFDAGTIIELYNNGKFKRALIKPSVNERNAPVSDDKIVVKIDNKTYKFKDSGIFENGRWFRLAGDTEYSGIVFKDNSILFIDSRNILIEGQLSRDERINILRDDPGSSGLFKSGTVISFHMNGNVQSGTLAENQRINIISGNRKSAVDFKKGSVIMFYDNGNILKGFVAGVSQINGVRYPPGSEIRFDADGDTKSVKPSAQVNVFGVVYQPASKSNIQNIVLFYKNGNVRMALLSGNQSINIIRNDNNSAATFKNGTYIEYYENGNVKNGVLAARTEIDEKAYIADSYLEFNTDGHIIELSLPEE